MHPSMVAHLGRTPRIVLQIDTQQLPSDGTFVYPRRRRGKRCPECPAGGVTISSGPHIRDGPGECGRIIFFQVLTDFAARTDDPAVSAVVERFHRPVRVLVLGRAGVGRRTVAAALAGSGVEVVTEDASESADVAVVVLAEALKPEDRDLIRGCAVPTVVALNKADLSGAGPEGPVSVAHRRAAEFAATAGVPVVPTIAHLATAELDDADFEALRTLITAPADMTSVDAFAESAHPLPAHLRARLMAALDRFGLAHAVLAVAEGASPAAVVRQLRELSGVDRVAARLAVAAAPVRYRGVRAALRELSLLAARSHDERLHGFLVSDDVVLAVMAAAVDVVEATGVTVDRGDDREAHLGRALHWDRYARGPVDALQQRCAADIVRGSLRLLERTG
jgi:hypothetical protein